MKVGGVTVTCDVYSLFPCGAGRHLTSLDGSGARTTPPHQALLVKISVTVMQFTRLVFFSGGG